MIINVKINNFLVYFNEVELSLIADMRIKKFDSNVFKINKFNVLKSLCIYGANNSGKTCAICAIKTIKDVLLGNPANVTANIFTDNSTCSFEISFIEKDRAFSYEFKYDSEFVNGCKKGFVYERLKELSIDRHKNLNEEEIFIRDSIENVYRCKKDKNLEEMLESISTDNILIYTINTLKFPIVEEYKNILRNFANKIQVVDMNNIPIEKTINVLKNDETIRDKTVELIRHADLDIDDYIYLKSDNKTVYNNLHAPQEGVLKNSMLIEDMNRLISIHKGIPVKSILFDSTGTKKIVAIASYIVEALTTGKILVIDELDSSLHFKLTRALVSLFNNEINDKAQLIFTAHDITLLDCKKLFRKDQIWFASKDSEGEYLYSLTDFNYAKSGIRSESDLFEKYNSGVLGAVPEPDLISMLFS